MADGTEETCMTEAEARAKTAFNDAVFLYLKEHLTLTVDLHRNLWESGVKDVTITVSLEGVEIASASTSF